MTARSDSKIKGNGKSKSKSKSRFLHCAVSLREPAPVEMTTRGFLRCAVSRRGRTSVE
jgi:hypothetical protein